MPSHCFVKIHKSGYVPSTRCGKGLTVGGSAPILLNKIIREPEVKGGSLESKTNQQVGIIAPAPSSVPLISRGGELLSGLSQISFDKNLKKNKRDNIKFIF